jgi:hypothetical protein
MVTENLYMDIPNTSLVQQMGQVYSRVLQRELVNRHGTFQIHVCFHRNKTSSVVLEICCIELELELELWSLVTTFVLFVLM